MAPTALRWPSLCDAYDEEVVGQDKNGKDDVRTVLRLHPALAPFKAAVLPLSKKLTAQAMPVWEKLSKKFNVDFDDRRLDRQALPPRGRDTLR